jgi:hypothetical protein
MSDEKQRYLFVVKENLRSIKETDKIREIILNVANTSESYCLKKCDIQLSKRLFNSEEILNTNEKKLIQRKSKMKENCYEVCVYKFFQSGIEAMKKAQKINR